MNAITLLATLVTVDRDRELQAMQMFGAEDAEELAWILGHLDKSWPAPTASKVGIDVPTLGEPAPTPPRRSNFQFPDDS